MLSKKEVIDNNRVLKKENKELKGIIEELKKCIAVFIMSEEYKKINDKVVLENYEKLWGILNK